MEEVEDIIPEEISEHSEDIREEFPEETLEVIPEKKKKLTEKVTCEGCGKSLTLHAYKYSHKCKARTPDEPPPKIEKKVTIEKVDSAKLKESLKEVRPALTQAQATKPIRQKSVIRRTPEYHPEPPYEEPSQQDLFQHIMQQRQQQVYMRHHAMLAPYQNMFASRAR